MQIDGSCYKIINYFVLYEIKLICLNYGLVLYSQMFNVQCRKNIRVEIEQ